MTNWAESGADPIGDLQTWAAKIADQSGYQPTQIFMTSTQKEQYDRFMIWFEETKRRLDLLPRRRWITRMILARLLYGPWHKRSRTLMRIKRPYNNWRIERKYGDEW